MFDINKSTEEWSFSMFASSISHQQNIIPQDLINNNNNTKNILARASNNSVDHYSTKFDITPNNMVKRRSNTQLLPTNFDLQNDDVDDDNKKKIIHREIEKQRRKEMATLHAQLRSLIPLEYIKGKRSMSDHMNGAVNYIKSLQARILELNTQRDDLIGKSNLIGKSSNDCSCVSINPSSTGLEIVLMSNGGFVVGGHEAVLPMSRVLQLLLGQGLTLVSCVSTKLSDQTSLHNIQAEVNDATCVDLSQLQQTLNEIIWSWNKSLS